jgi:protein phosphatase
MFIYSSLTDMGLKRTNNEDSLWVDESHGLFVVSDGMGGYERGEVASEIIIDTFRDFFDSDDESTLPGLVEEEVESLDERLNRIIIQSTNRIINYAQSNSISGNIGATVVGVKKIDNRDEIVVFHLGDSRAYRVRDYRIDRITKDHSQYEEMRSLGIYSERELEEVGRNRITKAVGNFRVFPLEINYMSLEDNDLYLLCSDGVSDLCEDEELLDIVMQEQSDLERVCINIKELVYQRGAKDNLSMIIFRYKKTNRG